MSDSATWTRRTARSSMVDPLQADDSTNVDHTSLAQMRSIDSAVY